MTENRHESAAGRLRRIVAAAVFGLALAGAAPARADEMARFIAANVIGALFHALGHAVIAAEAPPLPAGREEDAADAFAVLLIERLYGEAQAGALIGDIARACASP